MMQPTQEVKPTTVRNIDIHQGLYRVLSSNGIDWYLVDVKHSTCSCPCGQNGFRNARAGMCRHLMASKVTAKAWHDMYRASRSVGTAAFA